VKFEKHAVEGIHRVEDAFVNWYIVDDGGRLTIVDTGLPSSWKSMHQALGQIGRSPSDIDAVVLTHAHFDHMGFAERARRELGVPVLAHELEVPVTKSPWNYEHERARLPYFFRYPRFIGVFAAMGAAGALWTKGAEQVKTYAADDRLDVPGRPKVIFTPGHTYGHCSLHFPDRGAVIAGDAIVTLNPYTGHAGPQIVSGAATADSAQALTSLGGIAATGAQSVLTGHGPVWREGAGAAVERALAAGPS
jgi:glyoxylase-like metal-dependent hydrolase (beta-lactamase superfamily II)